MSIILHLRAVRELFVDALSPQQLAAAADITAALRARLDEGGAESGEPDRGSSGGPEPDVP